MRILRRKVKGPELRVVVATDVLSEGLNLQDCDRIINYDLHWNPCEIDSAVRGASTVIGSEHDAIFGATTFCRIRNRKESGAGAGIETPD